MINNEIPDNNKKIIDNIIKIKHILELLLSQNIHYIYICISYANLQCITNDTTSRLVVNVH